MMIHKPSVGKNIDGWCTRCKLILAHTIEAIIGDKVTRVHCNTCRSQHAHRPQPPRKNHTVGRSRSAPSRRAGGASREAQPSEYDTLVRGRDTSSARPYVVSERFQQADLLTHPTFGLGVVTVVKDSNKIEVVFADGPKTLVHER